MYVQYVSTIPFVESFRLFKKMSRHRCYDPWKICFMRQYANIRVHVYAYVCVLPIEIPWELCSARCTYIPIRTPICTLMWIRGNFIVETYSVASVQSCTVELATHCVENCCRFAAMKCVWTITQVLGMYLGDYSVGFSWKEFLFEIITIVIGSLITTCYEISCPFTLLTEYILCFLFIAWHVPLFVAYHFLYVEHQHSFVSISSIVNSSPRCKGNHPSKVDRIACRTRRNFVKLFQTEESVVLPERNDRGLKESADFYCRANFTPIRAASREISWPISGWGLRKVLRIASYNTQCQL